MNKTAMIWGAGGGIGRALVSQLREEGWRVLAMGRHTADLSDLVPDRFEADVADPEAVERAVAAASQQVGQVDMWIYAVGDITASKVAEDSPEAWQRILDANLTGAYLTAHYSLPLVARDGQLIFLGAVSERLRLPRLSAYAAAKAGLEAFVEVLGKEERKRRVTLVRPAAVNTPLWGKVPFALPPGALSPDEAANHILAAYRDGQRGVLEFQSVASQNHPFISLDGLPKGFQEGGQTQAVLRDVDAEFARGELVAILGESGSGKSTLLTHPDRLGERLPAAGAARRGGGQQPPWAF